MFLLQFHLLFSKLFGKTVLIWLFAAPNFMLSTARLIKLTVQYLNPGQTTCMAGLEIIFGGSQTDEWLPVGSLPLGTEFN